MLFLDTSALLKRYVEEDGTQIVLDLMDGDREWVASALARAETEVTLCHLGLGGRAEADQRRRLRDDWDHFRVVPVDNSCLVRATEIGCQQRVRTLDAAHLAAADRLPRPFVFLTFDRQQAAAARALGLSVAGDV
jgi:predicted nucleic acid-binding protein